MTGSFGARHIRLSTEPRFHTLMRVLMRELGYEGRVLTFRRDGHTYTLPLSPEAYTFQDHGSGGHHDCVACRVDRPRRFALFVHTAQGVVGPLGSTCLFERVLGLRSREAQRLSRVLEQIAREASHREAHAPLLRESGSHPLYLRALGFEWTRDARLLARAPLTPPQREALRRPAGTAAAAALRGAEGRHAPGHPSPSSPSALAPCLPGPSRPPLQGAALARRADPAQRRAGAGEETGSGPAAAPRCSGARGVRPSQPG
ncbi:hypothetical protein DAETH_40910 (plasmid) [Deinococcus aetherius]|uniref:Uncharacterized protein n=1 Tax=Deinococcus aetherius TaxID=200252 RepID=A0ABM8AJX1_9DEIO|nr:hypothetical protein [Deinococcus aetherius]BDP44122.1 hypothetical protein DAETH_40910 [Deinococcus aetherius]